MCAVCEVPIDSNRGRKYCSARCKARAGYLRDEKRNRKRAQEYRDQNRSAIRERDRARYRKEADHRRAYARRYYEENREAVRRQQRANRTANPEKYQQASREFYQHNKGLFLEHARRRKHRVRGATIVPFTILDLDKRLSMFPGCWICGAAGVKLHVDHVKPISKGGAHILANLRPACRKCNLSKGNKWPFSKETR